ncbi:MAG: class IV adenylate cyclase [Chloroflexi bacterium]|nr:class IV adenylate cyclase [Chloroflexota bacterium]
MPDIEEIEVKFVLPDLDAMRERLRELGARPRGQYHEFNIRLDDPDGSLDERNIQLRVRRAVEGQDTFSKLTVKTPSADSDPAFKIRREIETLVDDYDALVATLEFLGYTPYWRYEKYREKLTLGEVEICLDRVPIGQFMELEGPKEAIREVASLIGLSMSESLTHSYSKLFRRACDALGLEHGDLTFEALRGVTIDPQLFFEMA